MFEVCVEQSFASAHALRNYKGKCENVHGHNWKVHVVIEGEKLDDAGLLIDFLDVKRMMCEVIDRLDHQHLNDVPPFDVLNPSAENIAKYLYEEIGKGLAAAPVSVQLVKVWETDIQSASYRR
ncbi:MAG: 6-carboxytetrahydropterin synthase QueD [Bryobacteraceae bacterium]